MSAVFFDERAFADKVMARISAEPTPSIAGAAVIALRQRSPRLLLGAGGTAWHLATARTATVRPQLRFKSAALLSVMLLTLAMGTAFAAAGAAAVIEQVAHNLPALAGPHRPNPSHAGNNGGAPPWASHDPGGKRADPSAAPAGAQPSAGVGEPHPSDSPGGVGKDGNSGGGDGDGNGGDNTGKGQGDGNNGGGKGTDPDPTPAGTDPGDNHGGQTFGGGDGGKGNAGNGGNGTDHGTGGQDSGNGSGANNGSNGTNGNE